MSSDFFLKVYEVVGRIPLGRVSTYGAIARHLGAGRSSRMVGYALKGVFEDMSIPCHRVVNRNGELSGKIHFPTPTFMREMLESEGILFTGERVDMERHFWDPADAPEEPETKRAAASRPTARRAGKKQVTATGTGAQRATKTSAATTATTTKSAATKRAARSRAGDVPGDDGGPSSAAPRATPPRRSGPGRR